MKIETIKTSRAGAEVETEVWYNDGSLRRAAKGYWLAARLYENSVIGGVAMRETSLTTGSASIALEIGIARYSKKSLDQWVAIVKAWAEDGTQPEARVYRDLIARLVDKNTGRESAFMVAPRYLVSYEEYVGEGTTAGAKAIRAAVWRSKEPPITGVVEVREDGGVTVAGI